MKAIVTRANYDGTFDTVGMKNRIIIEKRDYATVYEAAKIYAGNVGSPGVQIEELDEVNIYGETLSTTVIFFAKKKDDG